MRILVGRERGVVANDGFATVNPAMAAKSEVVTKESDVVAAFDPRAATTVPDKQSSKTTSHGRTRANELRPSSKLR